MPIYSDGRLIETDSPPPNSTGAKIKKALGPLAGIGIVIAKFFAKLKFIIFPLLKFLPLILKTGGTMLLSVGAYALLFGWQFAIGFVLLIFVHECGHLLVAKKFGLKVSAPIFIPFVGAAILLKEQPQNAWVEAWVGIGGPIFGALGALVCNAIGESFNAPLFIALAGSGYFLNLFNLLPVGMLDGGRIVTAMNRWLWLPGFALLVWFGWTSSSILVWIIAIISLPRVLSLFRKRTEQEQRYFEVAPMQRLIMSVLYFGLIAMLAVGQFVAHNELANRGLVRRADRIHHSTPNATPPPLAQ